MKYAKIQFGDSDKPGSLNSPTYDLNTIKFQPPGSSQVFVNSSIDY